LSALAEVLWSPKDAKDYPDFLQRLPAHLHRLAILDVNFRPILPR
jgi:N-acetyl-beta-hexosaminidase